MIKTNHGLVRWCQSKVGAGYVYATYFAEICSPALIERKRLQYKDASTANPFKDGNDGLTYAGILQRWNGKECGDCVGLIKGYYWHNGDKVVYRFDGRPDLSANGMYSAAVRKGYISTLPEVPGVLVFYPGHVGVYIGNGKVIEARGAVYGVVVTDVAGRGWKTWGYCPYIEYSEDEEMLKFGDKNEQVRAWQKALLAVDPVRYDLGAFLDDEGKPTGADGSFGDKTKDATILFQRDNGVDATGVVDTRTYSAMLKTLQTVDLGTVAVLEQKVQVLESANSQMQATISGLSGQVSAMKNQATADAQKIETLSVNMESVIQDRKKITDALKVIRGYSE